MPSIIRIVTSIHVLFTQLKCDEVDIIDYPGQTDLPVPLTYYNPIGSL